MEQLQSLNRFLAERAAVRSDIAMVGMSKGTDVSKTREQYDRQFEADLNATVGPERAALIVEAEKNPAWAKVNTLGSRLLYQDAPLNASQIKSLAEDWRENPVQQLSVPSTEKFLAKAATYLTPVQVAALERALEQDIVNLRSTAWMKEEFKRAKSKGKE